MSFFSALKYYYIRKIKEAFRNPFFTLMCVGYPVMYLLLFAPLLKSLVNSPGFAQSGNVLNFFLPGVIVMLALFGGLYVGFGLIDEIRQGVIERFRVNPASRLALLLGGVLRDVTAVLTQAIIITLLAIPFGLKVYWSGIPLTLLILAITTALTAAFSYALALKFKSEEAIAPVTQGISLPAMLLAGFMLPMDLAPHWLQVVAHFNPIYYAVEASRALMSGEVNAPAVYQAFAFLLPLLAISFWWAVRSYRTVIS